MKQIQSDVREFMVKAGQETPSSPTFPSVEVRMLRVKLIAEELLELANAFGLHLDINNDYGTTDKVWVTPADPIPESEVLDRLVEAHDATVDLHVVVSGTDVAMGIDAEPGWKEVHRSNMSKFIDGYRRADGKWIKGPSYSPADLKPVVVAQIEQAKEQQKLPLA